MAKYRMWRNWKYIENEEDKGWKVWRRFYNKHDWEMFATIVFDVRRAMRIPWPNYVQVFSLAEGYFDVIKISFRGRYFGFYFTWEVDGERH